MPSNPPNASQTLYGRWTTIFLATGRMGRISTLRACFYVCCVAKPFKAFAFTDLSICRPVLSFMGKKLEGNKTTTARHDIVICGYCGKKITYQNMARHHKTASCIEQRKEQVVVGRPKKKKKRKKRRNNKKRKTLLLELPCLRWK